MSKQITNLRKAGKLEEAYTLSLSLLAETDPFHSSYIWLQKAYSWVLYDQLKSINYSTSKSEWLAKLNEIKTANFSASEDMFWKSLSSCVFKTLKDWSKDAQDELVIFLNRLPIDKLVESNSIQFLRYSLHKLLKEHVSYGIVISSLGFDNFKEDDFHPYRMENGKEIMSHVEQIICAYTNWVLNHSSETNEAISSWIKTIDNLSEGHRMKFPEYCKAKLYIKRGDLINAKKVLIPFVKSNTSQYWVWSMLAEIEANSETKISLYARALQCKTKDSFLNNVRLKLIEYFISSSMWSNASIEVNKVISTCKNNDYRISNRILSLSKDERLINSSAINNHEVVLGNLASKAKQVIFADDPSTRVIITYVNASKGMVSYYESNNNVGFLPMKSLDFDINVGDSLEIQIASKADNGYTKINTAIMSDKSHRMVKHINTRVTVADEKDFQFIEGIFFHHSLIKYKKGDFQIEFLAIPSFDKKKDKWGHKAIEIVSCLPIPNLKIV